MDTAWGNAVMSTLEPPTIFPYMNRRGGSDPHSTSARFVRRVAEAKGQRRERAAQPREASDQAESCAKLRIHILTANDSKRPFNTFEVVS